MSQNAKAEQQESRAEYGLQKVTAFLKELTALDSSMQISTALLLLHTKP